MSVQKYSLRHLRFLPDGTNCVVLNACDSDQQSEAIVAHINYVVGMSQPMLDKAATIFAVGFYQGLAAGKSVEQAYKLGCLAIQISSVGKSQSHQTRQYRKAEYAGVLAQIAQPDLPEHLKPVLRRKNLLSSTESSMVQEVLPSAQLDFPSGLVNKIVEQATDRE